MKSSPRCFFICMVLLVAARICPHETQLTQAAVQAEGIVRSTIIPLVGDARGMEAQPLILPNVQTPLSTGVIDPDTQRLYQVCWVSPDNSGNAQTARCYMHVLNVKDGSQAVQPVLLEGTSGTQDFNSHMRKQRSALVETNVNGVKTVPGCAGTIYEAGKGAASGWPDKASWPIHGATSTSLPAMAISMV